MPDGRAKFLADEIERWLRSDRIAMMYGPEIMRGGDVTREAAEDLAAILTQTVGASHATCVYGCTSDADCGLIHRGCKVTQTGCTRPPMRGEA